VQLGPSRVRRTRLSIAAPGEPNDVPGAMFFLASDDAANVTGQLLHVNGGRAPRPLNQTANR
jgi:NAD(P)-dependent dehydrogenase (short-subunit alcohol dehydrogenase family)